MGCGHPALPKDSDSGLWRGRPLSPEVVLEAHDVVEFGGRDFDELDALERLESVAPADRDVGVPARSEVEDAHRPGLVLEVEAKPAAHDVDRFVLPVVELERQAPT
jgi:hypothetical protein